MRLVYKELSTWLFATGRRGCFSKPGCARPGARSGHLHGSAQRARKKNAPLSSTQQHFSCWALTGSDSLCHSSVVAPSLQREPLSGFKAGGGSTRKPLRSIHTYAKKRKGKGSDSGDDEFAELDDEEFLQTGKPIFSFPPGLKAEVKVG